MLIEFGDYYQPTEKQQIFHRSPVPWKFIGGAMGGGKSYGGCAEIIDRSMRYPGNRLAIVRKTRTVLYRTTLVTFFKVCPPEIIANYNKSTLTVTLINGSEILFLEADTAGDPDLNKLRSLEISGFFMDEGPEMVDKAFRILVTRSNRWILPDGTYPPRFGIVAGNPEPGWCQERFVDQQLENHGFFPFKMTDNPHLSETYLTDLLGVLTELEIRKYIYGEWILTDDPNQLISFDWVKNAIRSEGEIMTPYGKQSLGVDVARYGDDLSVFARSYQNGVAQLKSFKKQGTYYISEAVKAHAAKHAIDADRIAIDTVGLGGGVYDNLWADHWRVKSFSGGSSPTQKLSSWTFKNLNAQAWWYLREMLRKGEYELPNNTRLKEDLTAIRYSISGEREIKVESKDDLKKRIGRSPDYGDAVVMGAMVDHLGSATVGGGIVG